jgi:hypothetical protein
MPEKHRAVVQRETCGGRKVFWKNRRRADRSGRPQPVLWAEKVPCWGVSRPALYGSPVCRRRGGEQVCDETKVLHRSGGKLLRLAWAPLLNVLFSARRRCYHAGGPPRSMGDIGRWTDSHPLPCRRTEPDHLHHRAGRPRLQRGRDGACKASRGPMSTTKLNGCGSQVPRYVEFYSPDSAGELFCANLYMIRWTNGGPNPQTPISLDNKRIGSDGYFIVSNAPCGACRRRPPHPHALPHRQAAALERKEPAPPKRELCCPCSQLHPKLPYRSCLLLTNDAFSVGRGRCATQPCRTRSTAPSLLERRAIGSLEAVDSPTRMATT